MNSRVGLEAVLKRDNTFFALPGNRTPIVQPVAYSLYWLSYPGSYLWIFKPLHYAYQNSWKARVSEYTTVCPKVSGLSR